MRAQEKPDRVKRLSPLQLIKQAAQAVGAKAALHRDPATPKGRAASPAIRRNPQDLGIGQRHTCDHPRLASAMATGSYAANGVPP